MRAGLLALPCCIPLNTFHREPLRLWSVENESTPLVCRQRPPLPRRRPGATTRRRRPCRSNRCTSRAPTAPWSAQGRLLVTSLEVT
jgi:hypothetical protein